MVSCLYIGLFNYYESIILVEFSIHVNVLPVVAVHYSLVAQENHLALSLAQLVAL